jgi:hypothetical protein
LSLQEWTLNLIGRISLAIKRSHNLAKASEPPGSRQIKRSFHAGHSLMHGAPAQSCRSKKRPTRVVGSRGANWRAWAGKVSALSQLRVGGAPRQPSETTHALVRQKKAPCEVRRRWARVRLGWGAELSATASVALFRRSTQTGGPKAALSSWPRRSQRRGFCSPSGGGSL